PHHCYAPSLHDALPIFQTPNALLENTTLAGMMNRRNRALIGDEIVNFAETDEVTPGSWELSHWLRGRKGTDTESHAIGERFVLRSEEHTSELQSRFDLV